VRRTLTLVVTVAALVAGCSRGDARSTDHRYPRTVRFGGDGSTVLHVAVASTEPQRRRGLMGVRLLPENAGMAFVWSEPTEATFWMKDTLVPLAIAFVDDTGRIVTMREMKPCRADPCPVYRSETPFVLAIEANGGWYDQHGVGVGDRATLGDA
jgi:hypothetical protein